MIQTLQNVTEYREDLIYSALCKSFDDLNIEQDLRPGMKVVIKPNLVMAKSPEFSEIIPAESRFIRCCFLASYK